jgi:ABC-type glutathione transport system ATPase component
MSARPAATGFKPGMAAAPIATDFKPDMTAAPGATGLKPGMAAEPGATGFRPVTVRLDGVAKSFGWGPSRRQVLGGVDLELGHRVSCGLVGESGSGKSTIAKIVTGIYSFDAGTMEIVGFTIRPKEARPRSVRDAVRYIPQNPYASFDPRKTIGQSLAEALNPLRMSVRASRPQIEEWLERVGLPASATDQYPHEFSGGERQRIAIARALCTRPLVVVADEITSALDVSVQADVLNLLDEIRRDSDFSMLFISHDLAVVRDVCSEVMVMRDGAIVERGPTERILSQPDDPYTQRLLDSIPGAPGFSLDG